MKIIKNILLLFLLCTAFAFAQKEIITLQANTGNAAGYTAAQLQTAITASDSGDCVIVYPGYYDLGADSLVMKNGVDLDCIGKVTFYSTAYRTIHVPASCTVSIKGFPTITNSHGLDKRIVLANATTSVVNDFWWEYEARLFQTSTAAPTVLALSKNTLGGSPVYSYTSVGSYKLTLTGAFNVKTAVSGTMRIYGSLGAQEVITNYGGANYVVISSNLINSLISVTPSNDIIGIYIAPFWFNIKVYP